MDEVAAGLLLVRVIVGLTLAAHGYNKFFGGGRIPGTARWFESIGMRPGRLHALFAAATEIGAGVLFAAGLLTPLAAAGFVGLMLVAAWTVHRENGFFSAGNGWEYNLVLAVVAAGVATTGPGAWSADAAIGLDVGGWGLLISAGGGLAAGAGLLAVCYRPAPRPEAAARQEAATS